MADNCATRNAGSAPSSSSSLSSVGGGTGIVINKGNGRLSSCRASFIHPNLKQSVPCRQNSFDSLNYSSSSDYENEWNTAAFLVDTVDGGNELSVQKLVENGEFGPIVETKIEIFQNEQFFFFVGKDKNSCTDR
jgi:hypothetical protein